MGVIVSYLNGSSHSNEPDPVTGLTPKEKVLVEQSWNLVKKDLSGAGIELFMMLVFNKLFYENCYFAHKIEYNEEVHIYIFQKSKTSSYKILL